MSKQIKKNFIISLKKVSKKTKLSVWSISKNLYEKICIKHNIKEQITDYTLKQMGGFSKLKQDCRRELSSYEERFKVTLEFLAKELNKDPKTLSYRDIKKNISKDYYLISSSEFDSKPFQPIKEKLFGKVKQEQFFPRLKKTLLYLSEKLEKPPENITKKDFSGHYRDAEVLVSALEISGKNGPFSLLRETCVGPKRKEEPKILIFDIETSPSIGYFWNPYDTTIHLNQVIEHSYLLSFAAKWLHDHPKNIIYKDQRGVKDFSKDSTIVTEIRDLLDEADIVITHNGASFDTKFINYRLALNKLKPPSSFKQIDTYRLAKKHFRFPRNSLDYLTHALNTKYKKTSSPKYGGQELWTQCLKNNIDSWNEMQKYNILDVLSLEELYGNMLPWISTINLNLYREHHKHVCNCGSEEFKESGFYYTSVSKFQKYSCIKCGAEFRDKVNLYSKDKKLSLKQLIVK